MNEPSVVFITAINPSPKTFRELFLSGLWFLRLLLFFQAAVCACFSYWEIQEKRKFIRNTDVNRD